MNRATTLAVTSKELMFDEPFYGLFLISLNKVWTKHLPTAGVSKKGINAQLAINPDFWDNLSLDHRKGLLKHELLHIAFDHLVDRQSYSNHKLFNIAADLEINQYIAPHCLPDGAITMACFPDMTLPKRAGTHYYYDALLKKYNEGRVPSSDGDESDNEPNDPNNGGQDTRNSIQKMMDDMNGDIHASWKEFEELSETEKKLIQKQIQHQLKEISQQTKGKGSIPGELQEIINLLFEEQEPPKFDWRSYLRRFASNSQKVYTRKSRRKENKRYSPNPGLKIKKKNNVLVAIDTSGSVSNEELVEFFKELNHIHKTGTEMTIVECDTKINNIEEYKPSKEYSVHGRGGTEFQPVIDYFNENRNKFNSIIYFTDGEAIPPVNVRCNILWVHSSKSYQINQDLPGFKIQLN